ncbi:MAG: hypothetical protein ABJB05_01865 [Parafilimonas sp.]
MSHLFNLAVLIVIVGSLTDCSVLNNTSSKYNFSDGYYYSQLNKNKPVKYYVVTGNDSIKVYPSSISRKIADTIKSLTILFPPHRKPSQFASYNFKTHSFDLDVLTILFKYRPAVKEFPNQLNTNFNGAVYTGYRQDIYKLSYKQNPLHIQKRSIAHS